MLFITEESVELKESWLTNHDYLIPKDKNIILRTIITKVVNKYSNFSACEIDYLKSRIRITIRNIPKIVTIYFIYTEVSIV